MAGATAELKLQGKNRQRLLGMRIAILSPMSFALGLLVLTCGLLAAIAHKLRRAPEAFEDETGFHFSSSTGNRLSAESGLPRGAGGGVRAALCRALHNVSRRREAPNSIGTAARRAHGAH
jgi:hypothetical protein